MKSIVTRVILSSICAAFCAPVFAEGTGGGGKNFAEHKAHILKELDEHIAKLKSGDGLLGKMQESRTCVANATEAEGLRKCHEAMKAYRMQMRSEWKEKREARMKDRQQKMQDKGNNTATPPSN